jgi:hypothetical protein
MTPPGKLKPPAYRVRRDEVSFADMRRAMDRGRVAGQSPSQRTRKQRSGKDDT